MKHFSGQQLPSKAVGLGYEPKNRNVKKIGAREPEVEEPLRGLNAGLIRSEAILLIEFEEVAEPKALTPSDLRVLLKKYGSSAIVAELISASEAFVRQNSKN